MKSFRLFILFSLFVLVSLFSAHVAFAATSFTHINTSTGSDGSPDAVSWSPGNPVMVDSYGHTIGLFQNESSGYYFNWTNDGGQNWSQIQVTDVQNRPTAVYDPVHDKIQLLYATGSTNGSVTYLRYRIIRDKSYNIATIELDPDVSPLIIDDEGTCTAAFNNPVLLLKDNGANGILVAFWSVSKDCGGTQVTETRAAMRTLSNDSNDGVAGNWRALNGSTDGSGASNALVAYNLLYTHTGIDSVYQEAAVIPGSGSHANDIYYFNVDTNDTNGFRRLSWNSGSSNWSGSWTARTTFGGNVNDGQGYNLKKELLSKPVYDPINNRVYVGIARWLDNTNGDTQSLFYINSSDAAVLASNIYSAAGIHCLYPTFDLAIKPTTGEVYFYYDISTNAGTCGDVDYKVYDGSTLSSATHFWTQAQSVDIPIVYQNPYNAQFLFLFRVNNLATPGTPPHDIYYGAMDVPGLTPTVSKVSISSPYTATSFADFNTTCSVKSNTDVTNFSGGELSDQADLYDGFETPTAPYNSLFYPWTNGVWSAGTFNPVPNGNLTIPGGDYTLSSTQYAGKNLTFKTQFSAHQFQHVGWVDDANFGQYVIVSTKNQTSHLFLRVEAGSGETSVDLGTGPGGNEYLGHVHTYQILNTGSATVLKIDGSQVASIPQHDDNPLRIIFSNNDTGPGSNLVTDWVQVQHFQTSGTYTSCYLDSGFSGGADWGTVSYNDIVVTSATLETRSSSDLSTWSSWTAVNSGNAIPSPSARYLQYRVTLAGTATSPSTFSDLSFSFTQHPDPTPTPSPSPSSAPAPDNSGSSNTSSSSAPSAPQCSDTKPGDKAPALYAAIPQSSTSIILFFSEGGGPVDHYSLAFGRTPGSEEYGADNIGGAGSRTFLVSSLTPNTKYYFKIRSGNGCATGNWSNEYAASTGKLGSLFSTPGRVTPDVIDDRGKKTEVKTSKTSAATTTPKTSPKISPTPIASTSPAASPSPAAQKTESPTKPAANLGFWGSIVNFFKKIF